MKKKMHYSKIACLVLSLMMVLIPCRAEAAVSYGSYGYDYYGYEVPQPAPYTVTDVLTGSQISEDLGAFADPADMFVTEHRIYIVDSGNNRIVVLKEDFSLDFVIERFTLPGGTEEESFNNPQGIYVTDAGSIYVADSYNGRVLEFDETGNAIRSIGKPETSLLSTAFDYRPMKLVVDDAGRIFISAYGVNLGLIELNADGQFSTFVGAIEVTMNFMEYIWRHYFTTEAQQARMTSSIPTEYSNIFIDEKDFIYGTISNLSEEQIEQGANMVRRLNPAGKDVLRRNGNFPITGEWDGESYSKFVDISVLHSGVYFLLDSIQGKIFCYDYDGNLIVVFGKDGNRYGNFSMPVAIGSRKEGGELLVLDRGNNSLYRFTATKYGASILKALSDSASGSMEESMEAWQEVIKQHAYNEFASLGIGRYYLQIGEYQLAMEYFQNANSKAYYSRAYALWRKQVMQETFGVYVTILVVVAVLVLGIRSFKRFSRKVRENKWKQSNV